MAINLTLREVKGQPWTYKELDSNFKELATKLAPLDSPVFKGVVRGDALGSNPDVLEHALVGWTRELVTGAQAAGLVTYALVGAANVFTQPQYMPPAVYDNQAVVMSQLKSNGFEAGDLKWTSWPRGANLGWVLCDGQYLPSSTHPNVAYRATYADLFSKIGFGYGADGTYQYFRVPDVRSRTLVAYGQGAGLTNRLAGYTWGEENHYLGFSEQANHQHYYTSAYDNGARLNTQYGGNGQCMMGGAFVPVLWGSTGIINLATQYAFNVIQPSYGMYLYIKY